MKRILRLLRYCHDNCSQQVWSVIYRKASFWSAFNGNELQKAITSAEKLVGYPTSLSSLKYLLADEQPVNLVALAKKLVGSGHPLLSTARDLLAQDAHIGHGLGGLWVLLLSKAAGYKGDVTLENELINGIHPKQRALAETTELISTAFLIHQSMVEIVPVHEPTEASALNFGNKLSILGGDFLLAKASLELSKLDNVEAVELISIAIGHISEGSVLSSVDMFSVKEWERVVFLLHGSLLGNSCEAALTLLGHDLQVRKKAFKFGEKLALVQRCRKDIERFTDEKKILKQSNFVLQYALEQSIELRSNYSHHKNSLKFSNKLRNDISSMIPDVIMNVHACENEYVKECEHALQLFPVQTCVRAIKNILRTTSEQ